MNIQQAQAFGPDVVKQLQSELVTLLSKRTHLCAKLRDSAQNKGIILRELRYLKDELRHTTAALHKVLLDSGITRAPISASLARYQNI